MICSLLDRPTTTTQEVINKSCQLQINIDSNAKRCNRRLLFNHCITVLVSRQLLFVGVAEGKVQDRREFEARNKECYSSTLSRSVTVENCTCVAYMEDKHRGGLWTGDIVAGDTLLLSYHTVSGWTRWQDIPGTLRLTALPYSRMYQCLIAYCVGINGESHAVNIRQWSDQGQKSSRQRKACISTLFLPK